MVYFSGGSRRGPSDGNAFTIGGSETWKLPSPHINAYVSRLALSVGLKEA